MSWENFVEFFLLATVDYSCLKRFFIHFLMTFVCCITSSYCTFCLYLVCLTTLSRGILLLSWQTIRLWVYIYWNDDNKRNFDRYKVRYVVRYSLLVRYSLILLAGWCWAKDDVTFFNMISGENLNQFDMRKLILP